MKNKLSLGFPIQKKIEKNWRVIDPYGYLTGIFRIRNLFIIVPAQETGA